MEERLKQRLVGAAVLACAGVVGIPLLLGDPLEPRSATTLVEFPLLPEGKFNSRVVPLETPIDRSESIREGAKATSTTHFESAKLRSAPQVVPAPSGADGADTEAPLAAWVVQLASFAKAENAMRLRDKLRDQGYTAFIEKVQGTKMPVTRVFVGPRLRREQANKTLETLRKQTGLEGLVVRYPAG